MKQNDLQHRADFGLVRKLAKRLSSCLTQYTEEYEQSVECSTLVERLASRIFRMERDGANPDEIKELLQQEGVWSFLKDEGVVVASRAVNRLASVWETGGAWESGRATAEEMLSKYGPAYIVRYPRNSDGEEWLNGFLSVLPEDLFEKALKRLQNLVPGGDRPLAPTKVLWYDEEDSKSHHRKGRAQKISGESNHYAISSVVDRIEVGMTVSTIHGPMKVLDIYIDMDEVMLEIERVVPSGETIKRPMCWGELKKYLEDY